MNDCWKAVISLILLGVGVFGAANWNCYCAPSMPTIRADASESERKEMLEKRELHIRKDVESAVIPFPVSVALTVFGFVGFAMFCPKPD